MGSVYDWARARGYWLRANSDTPPTHLLLDGGKLHVPQESHAAFLNAYAASVARFPHDRPCIVELRTPVFKMFVDLDTRFSTLERAEAALQMCPPLQGVLRCLGGVIDAVAGRDETAYICVTSGVKAVDDGFKLGFHLVWPEVLVTVPIALRLREDMLAALDEHADPATVGLVSAWSSAVDVVVYKSSGLRMPWSAKGREDGRYYEPRWTLRDDTLLAMEVRKVTALRETLKALSIRTYGQHATVRVGGVHPDGVEGAAEGDVGSVAACSRSLTPYAHVLGDLSAALPLQYAGQRFTGLVATDNCYMLRSTARYCFNLGRQHRTNNVYFMLTRRGVCQRCYCRCETADGRKYGMCKDFASEVWQVPKHVLAAFFDDDGGEEQPQQPAQQPQPARSVSAMPSRSGRSFLDFDSLVARSRPPPAKRPRRKGI